MLLPSPTPPPSPSPSSEQPLQQQLVDVEEFLHDGSCSSNKSTSSQSVVVTREEGKYSGLRRGPWTVDEDRLLVDYIASHGEGRWNSLAYSSGLKRTGKSCRLRWLNYLRPDVRRGNITPEEQLLILELHSRWGNRWSKIAQQIPGRTDNEIKNYWRTRVQKHAKQLRCDVNSKQFKDLMRYLWMPRLLDRIRSVSSNHLMIHHPPPPPSRQPTNVLHSASPNNCSLATTTTCNDTTVAVYPECDNTVVTQQATITTPSTTTLINNDEAAPSTTQSSMQNPVQCGGFPHHQTPDIAQCFWIGLDFKLPDSIWAQ